MFGDCFVAVRCARCFFDRPPRKKSRLRTKVATLPRPTVLALLGSLMLSPSAEARVNACRSARVAGSPFDAAMNRAHLVEKERPQGGDAREARVVAVFAAGCGRTRSLQSSPSR